MAASRVAAFLDNLRASQVLEPAQFEVVSRQAPAAGDDPLPLALHSARWLALASWAGQENFYGVGGGS
ncbi:MAG: hypothetical protein K2R98_13785, partial [Gemmataceae bacterium]|nr:hypothetical protein [Gemmataceae bacterium]